MTEKADITIDLDKTCTRCGAKGVTESGLCLKCVGIVAMDSIDNIRRQVNDRVTEEKQNSQAKEEKQEIDSKFIRDAIPRSIPVCQKYTRMVYVDGASLATRQNESILCRRRKDRFGLPGRI